jgi:hypothetical protein
MGWDGDERLDGEMMRGSGDLPIWQRFLFLCARVGARLASIRAFHSTQRIICTAFSPLPGRVAVGVQVRGRRPRDGVGLAKAAQVGRRRDSVHGARVLRRWRGPAAQGAGAGGDGARALSEGGGTDLHRGRVCGERATRREKKKKNESRGRPTLTNAARTEIGALRPAPHTLAVRACFCPALPPPGFRLAAHRTHRARTIRGQPWPPAAKI